MFAVPGQALRIGKRFREQGIAMANVHSSQWCRCLETARLLDLGDVIPTPALNSFFTNREHEPRQSEAVRQLLAEQAKDKTTVLVTHQVNVTALTGIFPRSGEIIVVRPVKNSLSVLGRIAP
ncbi:hypothetical protein [Halomonas sp. PR-M31]|uniref:hypothetical protein n=1 Tax=Halomonas sp. PR-M31 TaxID=1471202 RepID=UPI00069F2A62|nr:hypothetical protein [Halomonas sp. PR-M31]